MSDFDCAIVGAGIAGSCAAIALAKRGFRVVLLESGEFPRHKVCGEFLSPESRQVFRRLGVETEFLAASPPEISRAAVVSKNQTLEMELPPGALGISRWKMDEILWQAAQKAGAVAQAKTSVKTLEKTRNGFQIENWRSRTVLLATGRDARFGRPKNSRARRYIGLKAHFQDLEMPRNTVELHPFSGGYCGLNAIENGAFNACLLARYEALQSRSPAEFWASVLAQNSALQSRFERAKPLFSWIATANVWFGAFAPAAQNGALRVGDAAGYIHPLAGDGMAMAARAGELAAAVLGAQLQGAIHHVEAAQLYEASWRREFDSRLNWAAWVHPLLLSPPVAQLAVALGKFAPSLWRKIVKNTRGN